MSIACGHDADIRNCPAAVEKPPSEAFVTLYALLVAMVERELPREYPQAGLAFIHPWSSAVSTPDSFKTAAVLVLDQPSDSRFLPKQPE
jgi:hypothetical protein